MKGQISFHVTFLLGLFFRKKFNFQQIWNFSHIQQFFILSPPFMNREWLGTFFHKIKNWSLRKKESFLSRSISNLSLFIFSLAVCAYPKKNFAGLSKKTIGNLSNWIFSPRFILRMRKESVQPVGRRRANRPTPVRIFLSQRAHFHVL